MSETRPWQVVLAVVAALTFGAAVASVAGYATWRLAPHPVSVAEARAVAAELVPGGTVAAAGRGEPTAGGFPTWAWFDEPTDGGYTGVTVEPPPGYPDAAASQRLVQDMRRAGWRSDLQSYGLGHEVEGLKGGVYVYSSPDADSAALEFDLVRDSWPALKVAFGLGWLLGAVTGAALALRLWRAGAGRALAVGLAVLVAPTALATGQLVHFLNPGRHGFGLDVWGAYSVVFFTPLMLASLVLPVVVLVASGRMNKTATPHAYSELPDA